MNLCSANKAPELMMAIEKPRAITRLWAYIGTIKFGLICKIVSFRVGLN